MTTQSQPALIQNLMKQLRLYQDDSSPSPVSLLETHISWIILTGAIAYKIKKPVDLGFLDFSTLAKRKHYCDMELTLNARLAAELYLGIVPITGTEEHPRIGHADTSTNDIIEYAIRMRRFPQSAQLDNRLKQGQLSPSNMEAIGQMLASFHLQLPAADLHSTYGSPKQIQHDVDDNFAALEAYFNSTENLKGLAESQQILTELYHWVDTQNKSLENTLIQRKQQGFIRECHGDLHLRNLIWLDDHPIAFDCLEFDESLRWIDVMCEVAFLVMDLMSRDQHYLAYIFLNRYLQETGDYAGLTVLPYYLSYRAMVRAKVDALRHQQSGIKQQELRATDNELHAYLHLARQISQERKPKLIITRGMSASGKSTISKPLAAEIGAIRIRSDVERKRLFELPAMKSASSGPNTGLYRKETSIKTYAKLLDLARQILTAGFTVIVDAVFMHHTQRQPFQELAEMMGYDYLILEFTASPDTLSQRIVDRKKGASDANLAVLEHQLGQWKALKKDELANKIEVDTEVTINIATVAKKVGKPR